MRTSKEEWIELLLNDKEAFLAKKAEAGDLIDLSETEFPGNYLSDTNLSDIDFSGANFAESSLANINFSNCDLTSADFSRCKLEECDFSNCILNGTNFSYATLNFCNFNEADMAGCVLNEAELTDSDFATSENLSACRFDEVTIWPDTDKLPEDFDSTYNYDLSSLQDDEESGSNDNFEY